MNINTATPQQMTPAHLDPDLKEQLADMPRTREVMDQMIGQIGPYLLGEAVFKEGTFSFQIKGFEETFSYSSADFSERDELCAAFNADMAHLMLSRLFKEKGGELSITADSEVMHTQTQLKIKLPPVKGYIQNGVFALGSFIDKVKSSLKRKNETVVRGCEGFAPEIVLKKKYPSQLNLQYWFDEVLYLRSSVHPDLLSMEGVLRQNYMKKP